MTTSGFSAFTDTNEKEAPEAPIVNASIPVLAQQGYAETYEGAGEIGTASPRHPNGTIIIMHGYDPFCGPEPRARLGQLIASLYDYYDRRGYAIFAPTYNSWKTFVDCATDMGNALVKGGWPIHRTHMIGYSMGGLVCRKMVAEKFVQPLSLSTLCTPHTGTAPWVPTPTPGAMSLSPGSADIAWLNHNEDADRAIRDRYQAIGVCYDDKSGKTHHDDQLINGNSQLAQNLGFGKTPYFKFYEQRDANLLTIGGVHGDCQNWPFAGQLMRPLIEHIAAADARFG
ncbi:esterase/lipase family protein [Celeribacter sp.]|uniref:esterase/lipase family protein n=1 Tax=Celeribacter sp. TaxID=1890673 RepID=UPI003A911585